MDHVIPATRINGIEQVETCLKALTSYGYDTTALWKEHNEWLASLDDRKCTDEDRKWATQLPVPSSMEDHFAGGEAEVLTAARCHVGRQYSLSPGQRDVLRERYGLTPTMTVVAENVQMYKDTDVIFALTIRSTEHIDPKRRRVLNSVVLSPASAFFRDAAAKDAARAEADSVDEDREPSKRVSSPRIVNTKSLAAAYSA